MKSVPQRWYAQPQLPQDTSRMSPGVSQSQFSSAVHALQEPSALHTFTPRLHRLWHSTTTSGTTVSSVSSQSRSTGMPSSS
ncbi:hypothetical protein KKC22_08630, partial [Myxococcota bacterium]|nr:hypothetical protein [Myxococcota bacterium]